MTHLQAPRSFKLFLLLALGALAIPSVGAGPGSSMVRLGNHQPHAQIARSQPTGRMASNSHISLAVTLKSPDEAGLADLISRQSNPLDPLYGKFLTSDQFTARFAPTQADYDQLSQYFSAHNLRVTRTNPNRMFLALDGSVADIENAFQLEMHQYLTPEGTSAYAPSDDPLLSDAFSGKVNAIAGLNNFAIRKPHIRRQRAQSGHVGIGTGPQGGMIPSDIRKAYGLDQLAQTGTGQTLALFELDGYVATNPAKYASLYGITPPPLQNVLIGGVTGAAGSGEDEVELDIEMFFAVAPGASKILVYEAPNTDAGVLEGYQKIATDNLAKEVSTSWGGTEALQLATTVASENTIFMQMAAQGQSIFAAAGDSGAYDDGTNLGVDDPAAQPYMTGVGGTKLALTAGAYASESSWGIPAQGQTPLEGGGGGVSTTWPIPSYQKGLGTTANMGSTTLRMVPDVSLNADPDTGYSIYTQGASVLIGGTSAAAPLWAAFTALVNQARVAAGTPVLGFANPAIYQLASSSKYATLFHDIADSTTNLHYVTVTGYDLSTGWGSFNGPGLFPALVNPILPPYAPAALTLATHNTGVTATWSLSSGATSYSLQRSTSAAGTYTTVATSVAGTTYSDYGLSNGTTYFYRVVAADTAGSSGMSTAVSATPTLMAPQAPGGLTVTGVSGK